MEVGHPAFPEIYAEFQPKILRYLSRMAGETEAEDLTQEVFARVASSLESFRGEAQLSTWLYRIATNAALDRLRGMPKQPTVELDQAAEGMADKNAWTGEKKPAVESQVYRDEMNECIRGFIAGLPENYRSVMLLADFEGLKNEEIADVLGLTLDTVKIRLHRARERLKEELVAHCGPEWLENNEFLPEMK
jgi:RNA polymerase sigma-70 factor (ECF subfamily)